MHFVLCVSAEAILVKILMKLKCARDDVNVGAPEARRQATEQPLSPLPPSCSLLSLSYRFNCKFSAQVEAEKEREREKGGGRQRNSPNETIQLTIKVLQHSQINDEKINCICDSIP